MGNQSGRKAIAADELARLIDSEAHRVECVTFALEHHGKGCAGPGVAGKAPGILHRIAIAVRDLLSVHGLAGVESALLPSGGQHPAWLAVRDYLHEFEPLHGPSTIYRSKPSDNWTPPTTKNPAQGVIASKMVRCAILEAHKPVREAQDRARAAQVRAQEDEQRRFIDEHRKRQEAANAKARESKRKADETKLAKETKRRGTCGIEFAGASMRFTADDETVFLYRQDVRRVFFRAETKRLVIVDAHGTRFNPVLNGDGAEACKEVCDWRWRASESWEDEAHPLPRQTGAKAGQEHG